MPKDPEKPADLLAAVDEILIAVQQLRQRLRRMAGNQKP